MAKPMKGFSLVELMVAVAVLAILLAAAAPSFAEFFDRARLRGAADDVTSLIATARGEAVNLRCARRDAAAAPQPASGQPSPGTARGPPA